MRYAAYGSNLHPLRLKQRISSARLVTTSVLANWSLHFHKRSKDGSGKCNILPDGDGIHVAIFDISAADKQILDTIEGVGFGYSVTVLSVPDVGDCFSYLAEPSYIDGSLRPYNWYKELVLRGARVHRFPEHYVKRISLQAACQDPDAARRADQLKILSLLGSDS